MLLDNLSSVGLLEPKHLAWGLSITTLFTVALLKAISLSQNVLVNLISSILNVRITFKEEPQCAQVEK